MTSPTLNEIERIQQRRSMIRLEREEMDREDRELEIAARVIAHYEDSPPA